MRIIVLLLLICSTVSAQLDIKGTEYTIISDMGIANITVPRTNEERFSELDWEEINAGDLTSIVKAFVRDVVANGGSLDLSNTRHNIRISEPSHWNYVDPSPRNQPVATSYGSVREGFNVHINRYYWNRSDGIQKVKIVYHELGHGLMHLGHLCDFVWQYHTNQYGYQQGHPVPAIMGTGTCGRGNEYEVSDRYNLLEIEDLLRHFFEVQVQLPGASITGKGPNIIHN